MHLLKRQIAGIPLCSVLTSTNGCYTSGELQARLPPAILTALWRAWHCRGWSQTVSRAQEKSEWGKVGPGVVVKSLGEGGHGRAGHSAHLGCAWCWYPGTQLRSCSHFNSNRTLEESDRRGEVSSPRDPESYLHLDALYCDEIQNCSSSAKTPRSNHQEPLVTHLRFISALATWASRARKIIQVYSRYTFILDREGEKVDLKKLVEGPCPILPLGTSPQKQSSQGALGTAAGYSICCDSH